MSLIIQGAAMPLHAKKNGEKDTIYRACIKVRPDGTAELIVNYQYDYCLHYPLVECSAPECISKKLSGGKNG